MAVAAEVFVSDDTGNRGLQVRGAIVDDCGWKLNRVSDAHISVDPLADDAGLIQLNEMELAVVFSNGTVWQGIPRQVSGGFGKITFGCESVASYFEDAFVMDADRVYNADQLTIASDLVTYGQAASDQDRNIDIGVFAPSGVVRERTYIAEEYPQILDLLINFTNLQDGFDWDIVILPDGRREWTPYYPSKGSRKPAYKLEADRYGKKFINALTSWSKDGINQATDIIVVGAQDEVTGIKARGRWTAPAPTLAKYGRIQKVVNESSVITADWLNDRAQSEGESVLNPIVLPGIAVSGDLFGEVWHGDVLPVRIDYGAIQVDGDYRITELTWKPGGLDLNLQVA